MKLKNQVALLSVLMALVLAALTLGGLQLFGHGKARPSEWFRKQDNSVQSLFDPNDATSAGRAFTQTIKRSGTPPSSTGSLYDEKFEDGKLTFFNQWSGQTVRLYAIKGVTTDFYDVTGGQRYITLHLYDRQTYTFDIYVESNLLWLFSDDGTYTCVFTTHDDTVRPTSGNLFTVERNRPTVPLPDEPVKEGYTFAGWYYDEAYTQPYDGAPIYADTKLYAKMDINRYTVRFDGQNGVDYTAITVDWNTAAPLPTPTRTGYTFVGWFDGDTQYTDQPVKENKTLTAHWEIMTFTVTFMVDGETYKTVTVEYGTRLSEAADAAGLTYYTFYDVSGALEGRTAVITENTTLSAAEMSKQEKLAFFLARNHWIMIAAAALVGVLLLTTVVMAIVIKRG